MSYELISAIAEWHVIQAYCQDQLSEIDVAWFGDPECAGVARMVKDEAPPNQAALAARLSHAGLGDDVAAKCFEPVEYDPTVLDVLRQLAAKRLLSVSVAEGMKRLAQRGQGDLWAQAQDLLAPVGRLLAPAGEGKGLAPLVEWGRGYFQGEQYGYRSKWPCLDKVLGPLANNRLFVLSGRQKVGKSIWGLSLALDVATQGGRVVFNSLDMGVERTFLRLASAFMGMPYTKMWRKEMDAAALHQYEEAAALIESLPIDLVAISDVHEFGRVSAGADMAVVDYLQLCTSRGGERSKVEQVTDIAHTLKAQSRDHFVLAVSQLSRAGDPMWSSAIEQVADILARLHRVKDYSKRVISLNIELHRDGPTGRIPYYMFHEVERALEIPVLGDAWEIGG